MSYHDERRHGDERRQELMGPPAPLRERRQGEERRQLEIDDGISFVEWAVVMETYRQQRAPRQEE